MLLLYHRKDKSKRVAKIDCVSNTVVIFDKSAQYGSSHWSNHTDPSKLLDSQFIILLNSGITDTEFVIDAGSETARKSWCGILHECYLGLSMYHQESAGPRDIVYEVDESVQVYSPFLDINTNPYKAERKRVNLALTFVLQQLTLKVSSRNSTELETPLTSLDVSNLSIGFNLKKYDMNLDVTLQSLSLNDLMTNRRVLKNGTDLASFQFGLVTDQRSQFYDNNSDIFMSLNCRELDIFLESKFVGACAR